METRPNLIGRRFGSLEVFEFWGWDNKHNRPLWKCFCDCGSDCTINEYRLLDGSIKSCGCSEKEQDQITPAELTCPCTGCPHNMLRQIFKVKAIPIVTEYVREAGACMCKITPEEERAGIPGMRRGATLEEIAEIYGVNYNAVFEAEERVIKKIQEKLGISL